jgi:serine O-acetyltransferase
MNHSSPVKQHPHIFSGPPQVGGARTPASGIQSVASASEQSRTVSRGGTVAAGHDVPLPIGDCNANPEDISLLGLLAEDFQTHERDLTAPGFWAVALHRLGNARMGVRSKLLRAPLTVAYHTAFTGLNWLWGIDLCYTVKLGRRVRIWHHGGSVIGARAIGDDVHIRHNTTLGLVSRFEPNDKPIIGNRVDIGVGACILGGVTVGDDCVIGANSVVLKDLPAGSTALGIPARPVNMKTNVTPMMGERAAPQASESRTPA